jgi:hypothetical protein
MNLNASRLEYEFAARIARRALSAGIYGAGDYVQAEMDVIACHLNGCPLDLEGLFHADDWEFNHDMRGIRRHMDRATGELGECFVPRFAESEQQYDSDAVST